MKAFMRSVLAATAIVGAMSAAHAVPFTGQLLGANESPPVESPGIGSFLIDLDINAHTLRVSTTFSGLTTPVTQAHIHCCTPQPFTGNVGVATMLPSFPDFPSGTSGTYDRTFGTLDASTYNPAFVTANGGTPAGAEAALFAGLNSGRAYLNIHTQRNPGGELRGFALPATAAVPEPATLVLVAAGVVGLGLRRRRQAA